MIRKPNANDAVIITKGGRSVDNITTNIVMLALAEEPVITTSWPEFETTPLSGRVYKAVAHFSREYAEERNCQDALKSGLREYAKKMKMPLEDLKVFLFGDYYRIHNLPDKNSRLVRVRVNQITTAPLSRHLINIGITPTRIQPSVPQELGSIEDRFLLGTSRRLTIADNGNVYYGVNENTIPITLEYEMTANEYSQRNNDRC
tara:strand:- start:1596 stop:2204 length:609 start_codon:yes stop_codon:yes gene_type:complete